MADFVAEVRCKLFWSVIPLLRCDSRRERAMMGRLSHDQEQFFYSFRLDEAVPDDHPVREIAAVLDLSWVRSELAGYYSHFGRPSIDPVLMIRMLIIGYVFAIRSERALCRDVRVNLAYRWFCGLSIEDKIPDHSAFSRARNERFRRCRRTSSLLVRRFRCGGTRPTCS
jgi:transposase